MRLTVSNVRSCIVVPPEFEVFWILRGQNGSVDRLSHCAGIRPVPDG